MATSLIMHKRITTTVAKAKALRIYVEPLLTKAKNDTTHSRRTVFNYLQSKESVTELFREVAVKIADRPGGYTRIIKTGNRLGDNAEMCFIELVDYNELYGQGKGTEKKEKTTRRGRSRSKKGGAAKAAEGTPAAAAEETAAPVTEAAPEENSAAPAEAPAAETAAEVKDNAPEKKAAPEASAEAPEDKGAASKEDAAASKEDAAPDAAASKEDDAASGEKKKD